jgi:hypothetical protein
MTKVVINKRYGGFGLSPEAKKLYFILKGKNCYFYKQTKYEHENNGVAEYVQVSTKKAENGMFIYTLIKDFGDTTSKLPKDPKYWASDYDIERDDPDLIKVIEIMGESANDKFSELHVIDVPDDVKWHVEEYDGWESVHEDHRVWG